MDVHILYTRQNVKSSKLTEAVGRNPKTIRTFECLLFPFLLKTEIFSMNIFKGTYCIYICVCVCVLVD
jgi:hypothetical protein